MFIKKSIFVVFSLIILNGCAQNAAFLGPVITLANSGSVYQAGVSFGSDRVVNKFTGKSTTENIKEILKPSNEDSDFKKSVKKRIIETRKKLDFPN